MPSSYKPFVRKPEEIAPRRLHVRPQIETIPAKAVNEQIIEGEEFSKLLHGLPFKHVILVDSNSPAITGNLMPGHFTFHTLVSFLSNVATGAKRHCDDFYLLVTDNPVAVGQLLANKGVFPQTTLVTAPDQPTPAFQAEFAEYVATIAGAPDGKVRDVILTGSLQQQQDPSATVKVREVAVDAKTAASAFIRESLQRSCLAVGAAREF